MGKCIHHPGRETSYHCSKHNISLCRECMDCKDPELYCKHRPSCIIWFTVKEQRQAKAKKKERVHEQSCKHLLRRER